MVHIKLSEHDKAIKILHKNHFCKYILDHDEEEEDLFHDVTGSKQLCSVQLLRKLIYLLIILLGEWTVMSCFLYVSNICCVTRIEFWDFGADDQYKKNRPALNLVGFFWSDYVFLIFKDRLLNALFLFNRSAIECFQNVFFMTLFIVTFLLFNSCFLQHKPNLFMKLHYLT